METLLPNQDSIKSTLNETQPQDHGQVVKALLLDNILTPKQLQYALRVHAKLKTQEPILNVLKELRYVSDEQIQQTVRNRVTSIRIGSLLVELGLIKPDNLEAGLNLQATEKPKRKLGEVLVAHNFISERKMIDVLSLQLGFPQIDPEFADIDRDLLKRAPQPICWAHNFIPVRRDGAAVIVAFADPLVHRDLAQARNLFQCDIVAAIASKKSIQSALRQLKPSGDSARH